MSETGPMMDSHSGDDGQQPPGPRSLFELMATCLLVAGLWLIVAVLTEWVNIGLVALDGVAYMLTYICLVILLLGITILVCKAMEHTRFADISIKTPGLFQRGYVRICTWKEGKSGRAYLFVGGLTFFSMTAAVTSMDILESVYEGPRLEFYRVLAMVTGAFGVGLIWLPVASLIAGLWPGKRPGE